MVNQQIRAERVQLITQDGENIGIVSQNQALRQAEEAGLDLVLIAQIGKEGVPVVKIMDFGKVCMKKRRKLLKPKSIRKLFK